MSLENHLPLDVKNDKDQGDAKKAESSVEGIDGGEHGEDLFNVKSPEDVKEEYNTDNREEFFPIHRSTRVHYRLGLCRLCSASSRVVRSVKSIYIL